ncbi:UbiX family flavin prenyltransferase [Legionella sp.]|uniref:UbiX family flavin prenyltransferase n=1 Tax=Legionella sp. TaxID=459 RepID=UPI003CB14494
MSTARIIIGISGASGMIYGIRLLEMFRKVSIETHLIISKSAQLTRKYETDLSLTELKSLADVYHPWNNVGASIASGSFQTLGMIVAPCSMKTLAEITHGISSNLIGRAADVTLKERRKLVLMPRESPLHLGHLQNMVSVTQQGAIICPAMPAFYNKPETIADIIDYSVGRILDLFGIETNIERWQG